MLTIIYIIKDRKMIFLQLFWKNFWDNSLILFIYLYYLDFRVNIHMSLYIFRWPINCSNKWRKKMNFVFESHTHIIVYKVFFFYKLYPLSCWRKKSLSLRYKIYKRKSIQHTSFFNQLGKKEKVTTNTYPASTANISFIHSFSYFFSILPFS